MPTFIKAGFWETLCQKCTGYKGWLNLDKFIESKIPQPTYKVYTALLTQSGGNSVDSVNGQDNFNKGWTYQIISNPNNEDLTPYGAPNNTVGTYFVCNSDVPANTFTIDLSLSYNTGAPVVTVLENTIGNIWFSYDGVGNYIVYSNDINWNNGENIYFTIGGTNALTSDYPFLFTGYSIEANYLYLFARYLNSGNLTASNGMLKNTPIEIRVYN